MLLQHAWLAPLAKPETITEEDEDEVAAAHAAEGDETAAGDQGPAVPVDPVLDAEVADWVKGAIEKRKKGTMKGAEKPALHAAPLDAVQSPSATEKTAMDVAAPVEATA